MQTYYLHIHTYMHTYTEKSIDGEQRKKKFTY